jgi:hypothetical protein
MKILFKILDYIISVLMGSGTLYLVSLVVNESWNMLPAMIVGMVLGIAALLIAVLLFIYVTTAFELFPVGMLITMFTGMGAGMAITSAGMDFKSMLPAAIAFSISAQVYIDLYNMKLKGEVPVDQPY